MSFPAPIHLPLLDADHVWIGVQAPNLPMEKLRHAGFEHVEPGFATMQSAQPWHAHWAHIEQALVEASCANAAQIAVIPADHRPTPQEFYEQFRSLDDIKAMVASLWLGRAIQEDRLICHFQSISQADGRVYGYEALARAQGNDGSIIDGLSIITASRALNWEYRIDRYLLHKAIECYMKGGLSGKLFLNFFPGFIHRPEIYLNGVAQDIAHYGLPPERIVLDLTRSGLQRNREHLKSIADYCRSQRYSIALDDITDRATAEDLMRYLSPQYIKLDRHFARDMTTAEGQQAVAGIVAEASHLGVQVIAEGIETTGMLSTMQQSGIELFQGYYFGAPEAALVANTTHASA